ncbi:TadE/TadG family type IV pilus assembly protein [Arthrobacter oryzae]|uniref:TadE/TadG family type IV pilus assembly protein n=1 Tax=Arthrobacter oryzae TaxID=409290 RepID=UPI002866F69D|nr:TadE/TadG family type IV pilus assembly protein [Arthrobacter oryzae]MDR6505367.1 Flp pilus assembly protein TadG [Arthrobacter oryzae]
MKSKQKDRGAVAVEMAIVLPVLLLLLIGIMEFGRAFNVQVSLTQAAREGARHAAIHYDDASLDVAGTASAAAPSLAGLGMTVTSNASSCAAGSDVTVTTSLTLPSLSGFLDAGFFGGSVIFPLNMTGVGVMRCGG